MDLSSVQLPVTWDPSRDLVVLIGRGVLPLAEAFLGLGQEQIFLQLREGESDEALPEGVTAVSSTAALMTAILDLPGRLPAHIVVRGEEGLPQDELQAASEGVQDSIQLRGMLRNTYQLQGPTWLKQGIANFPALAKTPSVEGLFGAWKGKPCVLVSPGPSLSKNIALLPEVAKKALVIAGTHAGGALTRVGVAPDLLMAVDAGDLTSHLDAMELDKVGGYVVGATCQADNFERPAQRHFSVASNGALDSWIFEELGDDAIIPCGGSVACSALGLALRMGCDPIVMIGQDLSFPGGRAYAEETIDGDARLRSDGQGRFLLSKPAGSERCAAPLPNGELSFSRAENQIEVPGWEGGTVATNQTFYSYLKWFQAVADEHAGDVRLVNATEGGAHIDGMEHSTLAEMLSEWTEDRPDVDAMLDAASAGIDVVARSASLKTYVDMLASSLRRSLDLAGRCHVLADRALSDQRALEELGVEEGRLGRALQPLRLFSLIAQEQILMAQERGRAAQTLAENLAAARELFSVVEHAAGELYEPLVTVRRDLDELMARGAAA